MLENSPGGEARSHGTKFVLMPEFRRRGFFFFHSGHFHFAGREAINAMELLADAAPGDIQWDFLKIILPMFLTVIVAGIAWAFRLERLMSRAITEQEAVDKWLKNQEDHIRNLFDSNRTRAEAIADLKTRVAVLEDRGNGPRQPAPRRS